MPRTSFEITPVDYTLLKAGKACELPIDDKAVAIRFGQDLIEQISRNGEPKQTEPQAEASNGHAERKPPAKVKRELPAALVHRNAVRYAEKNGTGAAAEHYGVTSTTIRNWRDEIKKNDRKKRKAS